MRHRLFDSSLLAMGLFLTLCSASLERAQEIKPSVAQVPIYTYQVEKTWPHHEKSATEGLVYYDGALYESTGGREEGESTLRRTNLTNGHSIQVASNYFTEGVTIFKGRVFQLTFTTEVGFIYDLNLRREREFHYKGEGWGITHDDKHVIMSNGTDEISFIDPARFSVRRSINVHLAGQSIPRLNELEYIDGEIYANVYPTFCIVRIDPKSGRVLGCINLLGIMNSSQPANGIAYDKKQRRLFVTGKHWPNIFQISLKPAGVGDCNPCITSGPSQYRVPS